MKLVSAATQLNFQTRFAPDLVVKGILLRLMSALTLKHGNALIHFVAKGCFCNTTGDFNWEPIAAFQLKWSATCVTHIQIRGGESIAVRREGITQAWKMVCPWSFWEAELVFGSLHPTKVATLIKAKAFLKSTCPSTAKVLASLVQEAKTQFEEDAAAAQASNGSSSSASGLISKALQDMKADAASKNRVKMELLRNKAKEKHESNKAKRMMDLTPDGAA